LIILYAQLTRGQLPTTYGKEQEKQQYSGGVIFVDQASGYVFIAHQVYLNTHETIQAKQANENHCRNYGVILQEYLSDNGSAFTLSNLLKSPILPALMLIITTALQNA
jgi:hypothetical protein